MSRLKWIALYTLWMILIGGAARAADKSEKSITLPDDNAMATLKSAPGVETATANCAICHSTDYIVRQPGSDAKHWEAEVKKMVTVFGAPISDEDVKTIVNYLSSAYGPQATTKAIPPGASQTKLGNMQGSKPHNEKK